MSEVMPNRGVISERPSGEVRFEDPSSDRIVLHTALRMASRVDHMLHPLVHSPLLGRIGLLPALPGPIEQLSRTALTWNVEENRGLRWRGGSRLEMGGNDHIFNVKHDGPVTVVSIDTEADEHQLLTGLSVLIAKLRKRPRPSVLIIEKTGRYGFLPMILPGEICTTSLGEDLSSKAWLEWWLALDTVFEKVRTDFPNYYEKVVMMAQTGAICAASQPAMHFHLVEFLNKEGNERAGVSKDFQRVDHKEFGPKYMCEMVETIAVNKFLDFAELVSSKILAPHIKHLPGPLGTFLTESVGKVEEIRDWILEQEGDLDFFEFERFVCSVVGEDLVRVDPDWENSGAEVGAVGKFFRFVRDKNMADSEDEVDIANAYDNFANFMYGNNDLGIPSASEKIRKLRKMVRIDIPNVRPVFGAAFMNQLMPEILKVVDGVLNDQCPKFVRERIDVECYEHFDGAGVMPGVVIKAAPMDMAMYLQSIDEQVAKLMNSHWEKIFKEASRILKDSDPDSVSIDELQSLDCLLGLRSTVEKVKNDGVKLDPNLALRFVVDEECDEADMVDSEVVVENYLRYFLKCFASSGGSKTAFIHIPQVCPRGFVVSQDEDGRINYSISPGLTYIPIGKEGELEVLLASFEDLKWYDARLKRLKDGTIVKKEGAEGEARIDGYARFWFRRDKQTKRHRNEGDQVHTNWRKLTDDLSRESRQRDFFMYYLRENIEKYAARFDSQVPDSKKLWFFVSALFESGVLNVDEIIAKGVIPGRKNSGDPWGMGFSDKADRQDRVRIVNDDIAVSHVLRNAVREYFPESRNVKLENDLVSCMILALDDLHLGMVIQTDGPVLRSQEIADIINEKRTCITEQFQKIHPMFGRNDKQRKAHSLFQLTLEEIFENVIDLFFKRDSEKVGLERARRFVPGSKKNRRLDRNQCVTSLKDNTVTMAVADYVVEKSFESILRYRRSVESLGYDNDNATFYLKYVVFHYLTEVFDFNVQRFFESLERGDDSYIKDTLVDLSEHLLRDGFKSERYRSLLPEDKSRLEGSVDMIADCPIDLSELKDYCTLSEEGDSHIGYVVDSVVAAVLDVVSINFDDVDKWPYEIERKHRDMRSSQISDALAKI